MARVNATVTLGGVVALVAVVGVVGLLLWQRKNLQAVAATANKVNPLNDENIFRQGVDSVVQRATGDQSQTLGGLVWDWFNPDPNAEANERMRRAITNGGAGVPAYVVSPALGWDFTQWPAA